MSAALASSSSSISKTFEGVRFRPTAFNNIKSSSTSSPHSSLRRIRFHNPPLAALIEDSEELAHSTPSRPSASRPLIREIASSRPRRSVPRPPAHAAPSSRHSPRLEPIREVAETASDFVHAKNFATPPHFIRISTTCEV